MDVTALTASVHPGDEAQYSISVYPEGGTASDVTVQISLPAGQSTPGLPAPEFNICGDGQYTQVCTLHTMRVGLSTQMGAEVAVPSKAPGGGTVALTATVSAAAIGADSAGTTAGSASVSVVAASSTSPGGGHTGSPGGGGSGSHHQSGGSGGSGGSGSSGNSDGSTTSDTQPFDNLPPLTGSGSTSASGGDSSNLFPTVGPSNSSTTNGSQGSKASHKPYKATTVADILPLNTGQISGQLAGLIVLGLGIVLVFARISLRKPRSSEPKD